MNALKELVRSLAVIIILTSFMEMILPNSKMKNYLRLVLGLFVIVIILNPVLAFLDTSKDFSIQAWIEPSGNQELKEILTDAQEVAAASRKTALEDYAAKVEQQIAAIVKLNPEISDAEVEVALKQKNDETSLGEIEKISITARVEKGESKEDEITDGKVGMIGGASKDIERRIQSIISDFYGLALEQVSVNLTD